ncbi:MAG TPA: ABC transporter permease [Candidatus Polarisedimenticolia bacterium]|nr:ABC transporter permease [Candidatus Polarisedimenticolia bacterium]
MGILIQDVRHGIRVLSQSPGLSLVMILTLALGIGATTAIFSVVHAVLLNPLPYPEPERLVLLWDVQPGLAQAPASYPEFLDWRERSRSFQEVTARFDASVTLTGGGRPEKLNAMAISANLLPALGVKPLLGRGFRPDEELSAAEPVVLISDRLWHRRFGGDPKILGRTVILDARPQTIVGVLPEFRYGGPRDLWMPLRLDTERAPRGLHFIVVMGRLRPGKTLAAARQEMEGIASQLRRDGVTNHGILLVGLKEQVVGRVRPTLLILFGAVGLVLLIACSNVANLLLARSTARQKEIAIRQALGAGRIRLMRQFLTEGALVAAAGGGLGLLLAWWGMDGLIAAGQSAGLPRMSEIAVDPAVLAFTAAASLLTGLLCGLFPAWQNSRQAPGQTLREGGRRSGAGTGRGRLRSLLVVSEVALSIVLLVGAGLLIHSFVKVLAVPKGFDPSGVVTAEIDLPPGKYAEPARQAAFFQDLLQRVRPLPGVRAAAVVSHLPLSGQDTNGGILIEGRAVPTGEEPLVELRIASPDYFRAMGIPVLRGRAFTEADDAQAPAVAVINQAMARRLFPGQDPMGKRIDMQWLGKGWQEVVGVVGDVKHDSLDAPTLAEAYAPLAQRPNPSMNLVVRAASSPVALAAALRERVSAVDPDQPVSEIRTLDRVVADSTVDRRFSTILFGGFAGVALFLATLGLYGVIAYSVTQRTHEIGVRMALGARRSDVLRLVVGQGLRLVAAGVGLGLAAALPLAGLLSGLLFGVPARDPMTFGGVPILLAAVAWIACYLPARRATKVDPIIALRVE